MDSGEMARYSVKRNDDGDKTMVLEYVDRIQTVKDSDLLEDLVKMSKAIGHAKVTIAEYDAHGNYNSSTITRHFKTWNKALEDAGLQISNRQYTIQELYDNLAEYGFNLGGNRPDEICRGLSHPFHIKRMKENLESGLRH